MGGWLVCLEYLVSSLVLMITIIGIPFVSGRLIARAAITLSAMVNASTYACATTARMAIAADTAESAIS